MKEEIRKSARKRKLKISTIVILLAVLVMLIRGVMYQPQITDNYDKISDLEAQIEYEKQRAEEVDALKENVDSDEYIEKIAREELGMVRKDEMIFIDITGEE